MKPKDILYNFLFVLILPFIGLATFSRYPPYADMNLEGLLWICPLMAVLATTVTYFYNKKTGKGVIKFRGNFKRISRARLYIFFTTLLFVFLAISSLMAYGLINIPDSTLYIITAGIACLTTAGLWRWARRITVQTGTAPDCANT